MQLAELRAAKIPLEYRGKVKLKISREEVLRVAETGAPELTPEEIELYRGRLDEAGAAIARSSAPRRNIRMLRRA